MLTQNALGAKVSGEVRDANRKKAESQDWLCQC